MRQGDTATVQTTKGEQRAYTVAFVLAKTTMVADSVFLPRSVVDESAVARIGSAFVKADAGVDAAGLRTRWSRCSRTTRKCSCRTSVPTRGSRRRSRTPCC
ncbi:hypothetical protein [Saccharothrix saharensis]|uniref:hypothetical protein n=1 Tax=Saccharothrix saharensis TaxID=571190 RepID=UPI001B85EAED|nr:hypothetical protein [Saccharothrix saharensis]